jgi:hypothetical protein
MHNSMVRCRPIDELEDTMELFLTPDQICKLDESAQHAFGGKPQQRAPQVSRLRLISMPERRVIASPSDVPIIEMPAIDRVIAARTGPAY